MSIDARQESDLQNLQQIVSGLTEGVMLIDPDQTLRWANNAALKAHGVRTIEELGHDVAEYRRRFHLRYRNNHLLDHGNYPIDRVVAGETFSEIVVEVTPVGGTEPEWTHQVRSMVMTDEDGGPERLVLIIQDVSDRFEAEDRFEQTFNANPAPALICRLSDQRFIKVNRGFLDLTGFDRDDVIGRTAYEIDLFNGADQRDRAKQCLHDGVTVPQMEAELGMSGGGTRLVIIAGQPIELDDQDCMLFTLADLERRRLAETALVHSEARFDRTFQMAPAAMMITSREDLKLVDINPAFERMTGYDQDATADQCVTKLDLWETAAIRRSMEAELRSTGLIASRDARLRGRDGALIDCLVSASVIEGGTHPCVLWVLQDISDRRSSEAEMLASIEAVMKDASWFSRALVEKLANLRVPPSSAEHVKEVADLTPKEKQVLGLMCQGADDARIGETLNMSRNTVRNHVARIYGKIGVNKRGAAIVWARERGLNHGGPVKTAP
ncbi:helix-turn-helix transcriptional regulator [Sphingomonas prati]|uniref:PAS domain S-box-containing protein n=1 Tax=Sphingomonas prati TaxID=1843237 RepID=A0A7W9BVW1_9SPHN|nr:PAS domain S-box protein [Sphingomonas prati]MBB5730839.1 PAS domain S-box-containing protein [Sphingomonas prati]